MILIYDYDDYGDSSFDGDFAKCSQQYDVRLFLTDFDHMDRILTSTNDMEPSNRCITVVQFNSI